MKIPLHYTYNKIKTVTVLLLFLTTHGVLGRNRFEYWSKAVDVWSAQVSNVPLLSLSKQDRASGFPFFPVQMNDIQ